MANQSKLSIIVCLFASTLWFGTARAADPGKPSPELELPQDLALVAAKVTNVTLGNKAERVYHIEFTVMEVYAGVGIRIGDTFDGNAKEDDPNGVLIRPFIPKVGENGFWRLFGRENKDWSVDIDSTGSGPFPARQGVDDVERLGNAEAVCKMLKPIWAAKPNERLALLEPYLYSRTRYFAAFAGRILGGNTFSRGSKFEGKVPILERIIQKPGVALPATIELDLALCEEEGNAWINSNRRANILVDAVGMCATEDDEAAIGELESRPTFLTTGLYLRMLDRMLQVKVRDLSATISTAGLVAKTPEEREQTFDVLIKMLADTEQPFRADCVLSALYNLRPLTSTQTQRLKDTKIKVIDRLIVGNVTILLRENDKQAPTTQRAK